MFPEGVRLPSESVSGFKHKVWLHCIPCFTLGIISIFLIERDRYQILEVISQHCLFYEHLLQKLDLEVVCLVMCYLLRDLVIEQVHENEEEVQRKLLKDFLIAVNRLMRSRLTSICRSLIQSVSAFSAVPEFEVECLKLLDDVLKTNLDLLFGQHVSNIIACCVYAISRYVLLLYKNANGFKHIQNLWTLQMVSRIVLNSEV